MHRFLGTPFSRKSSSVEKTRKRLERKKKNLRVGRVEESGGSGHVIESSMDCGWWKWGGIIDVHWGGKGGGPWGVIIRCYRGKVITLSTDSTR